MVLRMPRPKAHPTTGIYLFRKRVPEALRSILGKTEEKISLRTRDPAEAKIAHARVSVEVEERWHRLAQGPQSLSHRQAEAIAGEIYRSLMAEHHDDPQQASAGALLVDQAFHGKAKIALAGTDKKGTAALVEKLRISRNAKRIDEWLSAHGYILTGESRELVRTAVDKAILQAREQLHRMRGGDYRPDPDANRFPSLEARRVSVEDKRHELLEVFDEYARESVLSDKTIKKWRPKISAVSAEVPDIRNLTRQWCIAWKDKLVAAGVPKRSVREIYLASLKAVCSWALNNSRIDENPVIGVTLKVPKRVPKRGYTEAEAEKILRASLEPVSARTSPKGQAARRWVPMLCAYTGARVGEIAQLRKTDIKKIDDVWMLRISPEAGTVKTSEERTIAIHPELLRQGFIEFVSRSSETLFYAGRSPRKGSQQNPTFAKVGERLAKWIREEVGIADKNVSPNHGWRHRFKTMAEDADMRDSIIEYIQGHAPATVGRTYGERLPRPQFREISKFPVIDLGVGKKTGRRLSKGTRPPIPVASVERRKSARSA